MRSKIFILYLFVSFSLFAAEDIKGFWKTVNEEGVAQCIIAVYEYQGLYYGRIIATFNEQGKIDDSIYSPKKRAPGIVGTPFYSGLDIIWDLADSGSKFKGKIVDPEKGNIYNSELWIDHGDLIVRGKLLFFGRSQTWFSLSEKDLPEGFKLPSLKSLTPSIPQVN